MWLFLNIIKIYYYPVVTKKSLRSVDDKTCNESRLPHIYLFCFHIQSFGLKFCLYHFKGS